MQQLLQYDEDEEEEMKNRNKKKLGELEVPKGIERIKEKEELQENGNKLNTEKEV